MLLLHKQVKWPRNSCFHNQSKLNNLEIPVTRGEEKKLENHVVSPLRRSTGKDGETWLAGLLAMNSAR